MKKTSIQQGAANWAMLQDFVKKACDADSSLARKSKRFAVTFAERQERERARILSRPGTKAYRDYMSVPI